MKDGLYHVNLYGLLTIYKIIGGVPYIHDYDKKKKEHIWTPTILDIARLKRLKYISNDSELVSLISK